MTHYTYRVQGRGDFPLDMLRYDECWGVGRADRAAIKRITDVAKLPPRVVTLIGPRTPTTARWASFGWTVIGVVAHTGPCPTQPLLGADAPQTQMEAW